MKNAWKSWRLPLLLLSGSLLLWSVTLLLHEERLRGTQRSLKQDQTMVSVETMDTILTLNFYGATERERRKAVAIAVQAFRDVSASANTFDPQSEISCLNAAMQQGIPNERKLSPILWEMLEAAQKTWRISGGAFDITITPLSELWGMRRSAKQPASETIPTPQQIATVLTQVGSGKFTLDAHRETISFGAEKLSLDLGAVAKGYAVDLAYRRILSQTNVRRGEINAGGTIRVLPEGGARANEPMLVGIAEPASPEHWENTILLRPTQAIATSGNYHRLRVLEGRTFSHIIDPRSGCPLENREKQSISVVAESALMADLWSTALCVEDTLAPPNGVYEVLHLNEQALAVPQP